MRDYLLIYINGRRHEIRGDQAFMSLSDYLRYDQGLVGTKVVCSEGDCGACTILRGTFRAGAEALHYESINSCIAFMHLMDCSHIITIEGLSGEKELNPVQQSMVDHHGAQCGFCTPGFICAMTDFVNHRVCQSTSAGLDEYLDERQLRNALTGNLCRCTGYGPIIEAGTHVNLKTFRPLQKQYDCPEMHQELRSHQNSGIHLETPDRVFYAPTTLSEAVAFHAERPEAKIFSSATDMGVLINKDKVDPLVITNLSRVAEAHEIEVHAHEIVVGARVTLTQLENACRNSIPEFSRLMRIFASPQIKNKGTLVGNIANASPIADTIPFLFVAEAELELLSPEGARRVNINDFYLGYKQLDLRADELISRVFIPIPNPSDILKLYKVSNRKDLDISTFTAAIRLQVVAGKVQTARIAFGGVGPTVLRLPQTEALLQGQEMDESLFVRAGKLARTEVTPISDVRASAAYRSQLAENILPKFYYEIQEHLLQTAEV